MKQLNKKQLSGQGSRINFKKWCNSGIKADKGAKPMAGSSEETVTEGLDGLRERLKEYYNLELDSQNGGQFIKLTINFIKTIHKI